MVNFSPPIIIKPENVKLMDKQQFVCTIWLRKNDISKNIYVPASMIDKIHANDPSTFILGTWREIIEDGCAFQDIRNCGSNNNTRNYI